MYVILSIDGLRNTSLCTAAATATLSRQVPIWSSHFISVSQGGGTGSGRGGGGGGGGGGERDLLVAIECLHRSGRKDCAWR